MVTFVTTTVGTLNPTKFGLFVDYFMTLSAGTA
jgi:hypothetical protein